MTDKEVENFLSKALLRQYEGKWDMLKQAIEKYPNELWGEDKGDWTYSWTIHHIIETTEYYIANSPESMKWGKRVGIDWDNDSKESIIRKKAGISKTFLLEYLEEMKNKVNSFLKESNENDMMEKDEFHWFHSIFEKLVYLLRHNTLHLGELSKTLRDNGFERMKWI